MLTANFFKPTSPNLVDSSQIIAFFVVVLTSARANRVIRPGWHATDSLSIYSPPQSDMLVCPWDTPPAGKD